MPPETVLIIPILWSAGMVAAYFVWTALLVLAVWRIFVKLFR